MVGCGVFVKQVCQVFVTVHNRYQITKEKRIINEIEILVDHYYIPSVWLMTLRRRHHYH